jgi:hypothetical protein
MYTLNSKNMAVTKLLPEGKDNPRLKHIHVSAKGATVVQPAYWCRVSLPEQEKAIQGLAYLLPSGKESDWVDAKTTPEHLVPNVEALIPEPNEQAYTLTLNGDILAKILAVANEVNEDSLKTIRLRWCPDRGVVRIDTYAEGNQQRFLGVMRPVDFQGYIEGDVKTGEKANPPKPVQLLTALKQTEGRRFRSE